ncbi:MAG: PAS domain S-box protein [Opitutaceae bacterium]|jgi:two-component system, cell cycle sensor histidine kinase and response regulator CckA|nr:PAS domain S-box protein [Opitutaceae bacterium]
MPKSASTSKSSTPSSAVLSRMFKGLSEGVMITEGAFGRNGWQITHANPALAGMTGFSAAELTDLSLAKLHKDRGDLTIMRSWAKKGAATKPLTREGYLKRQDRSFVFVAWTLSALTDGGGNLVNIMITYQDMTANRQLREALVHSQRLDAVGRLAGGVAHDFNNLLSVINGYTEILHHQLGENSGVRKELQEIYQAGQRASTLVHQLLAFGRRQKMAPRVIEVNRLVHEHVDILSRLLGEHRSLELDLDENTGNVHVDPTQLQQVFLNLVLNARDATKKNGRISVRTQNITLKGNKLRRATDPRPGDYVELTVSDNGTGMDESTLKTLFEPFFTTKSEGKGTGLGLALVYGVIKQSGGYVDVESESGRGSTFRVRLPRTREPVSKVRGKLAPLPVTGGRETLLIIEEDRIVGKMVEGILAADGYDVTTCTSVAAAEVAMDRLGGSVHLVIADPTAQNSDVAKIVRKLHRGQKGLRLLSTPNQDSDPITGIPAKHQTVLTKPFALSSLLYEVRSLLDVKG